MQRILIVGAGDFGRELFQWVSDGIPASRANVAGFLDDDSGALEGRHHPAQVVASVRDYKPQPGESLAMGISDPRLKLKIGTELAARGASFLTFVHPRALIGMDVTLGRGCVLCPNAVVSSDARLGDFVTVNLNSTVGHDTVLGDGCTLSSQVDIAGFARLGTGVFLGSHASVLPRAKVGDFARIGAGSVVLKLVSAGTTVFGVPAKKVY